MSQLLDGIKPQDLTEDHLKSLVLLNVAEDYRIEYKQSLKMGKDSEKRELCKDVSALANSQGGYLFFGISEKNGRPSGVPGIDVDDTAKQQLYQVLTSGVSPRIQSITDETIPLRNGKNVLLLKLEPDGYLHQVKYNDERYYKRAGTITVSMQSSDVETFFLGRGPSTRQEQVQEITQSYYSLLKGRKYFKGVGGKGICALTVIPEVASYKLDMSSLPGNFTTLFQPLYCSGWDSEVTGRSRFIFGRGTDDKVPYAVTEVTELAEVKAFNSFMLENRYGDARFPPFPPGCMGFIPSIAYERELILTMHRYLNALKELGVSPPFFLRIALLGVQGYILYVDPMRFFQSKNIYQGEDILPNLVHLTSEQQFKDHQTVAGTLRPSFDFVWREFGFERCYDFDDNGKWMPD